MIHTHDVIPAGSGQSEIGQLIGPAGPYAGLVPPTPPVIREHPARLYDDTMALLIHWAERVMQSDAHASVPDFNVQAATEVAKLSLAGIGSQELAPLEGWALRVLVCSTCAGDAKLNRAAARILLDGEIIPVELPRAA